MKNIVTPFNIFTTIIGKQKINKAASYRKFNFVSFTDCVPFLAYNGMSGRLDSLTEEEFEFLIASNPYTSEMDKLIEDWFLVPSEFDDFSFYKQFVNLVRMFEQQKGITDYTIMTTTDCNARCFYCYENGIKKSNMTEETAHKLADYIISHRNDQKIKLHWFGGEPLYNNKVINIICDDLNRNNIPYVSTMISNAYLFNDEVIENAKKLWNLKEVQITLDGTEEVYNKVKNYIYTDDNSPFLKVCDNIEKLLKANIGVAIRINLDMHNCDDMQTLSSYIINRYSKYDNIRVYCMPLFDFDNQRMPSNKEILINKIIAIEKEMLDYGLVRTHLPRKFSINRCMADSPKSTLVNPDGKLGTCEHFAYSELWGDVYTDKTDLEVKKNWYVIYDAFPACINCEFLPNCFLVNKCPETEYTCDEISRKLKRYRLERAMLGEWQRWKEGTKTKNIERISFL